MKKKIEDETNKPINKETKNKLTNTNIYKITGAKTGKNRIEGVTYAQDSMIKTKNR